MTWVKVISEDNATGELKRAYELVVRTAVRFLTLCVHSVSTPVF